MYVMIVSIFISYTCILSTENSRFKQFPYHMFHEQFMCTLQFFFIRHINFFLNLQVPTHNKPVVIKRIPGIVRDFAVMLQYRISCIHQFSWIIQLFRNRRNGEIIPQNTSLFILVWNRLFLKHLFSTCLVLGGKNLSFFIAFFFFFFSLKISKS